MKIAIAIAGTGYVGLSNAVIRDVLTINPDTVMVNKSTVPVGYLGEDDIVRFKDRYGR